MLRAATLFLGFGLAVAAGCKHENPAAKVPVLDEFTAPPDDPRYNTPPMSEYKKPSPKKDWGAKPGMAGSQAGGGPQFLGQ
jgi:hypothetical protein